MNDGMNQESLVIEYLRNHGSISQREAYRELGISRLAATIWKLRHKRGMKILSTTEVGKNRFGKRVTFTRYWI